MEKHPVSAESIARLAEEEKDISSYFTNDGKMMPPVESGDVIEELNEASGENRLVSENQR